jgi:hypothetical protein
MSNLYHAMRIISQFSAVVDYTRDADAADAAAAAAAIGVVSGGGGGGGGSCGGGGSGGGARARVFTHFLVARQRNLPLPPSVASLLSLIGVSGAAVSIIAPDEPFSATEVRIM